MRALVVTLEHDPLTSFSGNGVLARALARALATRGVDVFVLCATPRASDEADADDGTDGRVIRIPVPMARWHRLDRRSAHDAFARGCADARVVERVRAFACDVAFAVDFTSVGAVEAIGLRAGTRVCFCPFRVFARLDGSEGDAHAVYERAAVAGTWMTIALSRSDAMFVMERLGGRGRTRWTHPPLRRDAAREAMMRDDGTRRARRYVSCVVRPSEEKKPHRFVAMCEELARRGVFDAKDGGAPLAPLMCINAEVKSDYARDLRRRFEACSPNARVVDEFLGPRALGDVFEETLLNVHPPSYDSFGMTIIEAAAFGAPTVMHNGGDVGARDLLSADSDVSCFDMNMEASASEQADVIETIINDPERIHEVAQNARLRALKWDEDAFGEAILDIIREN